MFRIGRKGTLFSVMVFGGLASLACGLTPEGKLQANLPFEFTVEV